jgi:hypothetical protein
MRENKSGHQAVRAEELAGGLLPRGVFKEKKEDPPAPQVQAEQRKLR